MNLTVCIPTYNEELNIKRCLDKLKWAKNVKILDSFSSDKTLKILKKYKNVKIYKCNSKTDYVQKLRKLVSLSKTNWVMLIDSDYILSDELIGEIKKIKFKKIENKYSYFEIKIFNKIFNKVIKENLYPSKKIILNKKKIKIKKKGHSELITVKGPGKKLKNCIYHENYNDILKHESWKKNQKNYAKLDAIKIKKTSFKKSRLQDKLRKFVPLNIILLIFYLIFFKNILKYKKAGIFYLYQRLYFEINLSKNILKN